MNRPSKFLLLSIGAGVAMLMLAGVAYWLGTQRNVRPVVSPASAEREVLYWYDPMYPDKHFDQPGKSPFMDMQLLPKYADTDASGNGKGTVRVTATTLQNLGMRTAQVEIGTLPSGVRVPGTIAWDLRSAHAINARADGVIETLYARTPYEPVRAGQVLAELIAPEWSAAVQEYLALGRAESADARALQAAARNRLRVLGMDDVQIRSLRDGKPRVLLRAPADGVVSELEVRQGQWVQAGMPLMTVNSLDTVWIEAAIPQAQAAGIVPGTPVRASVSAFPGESFRGEVESLLPSIDIGTRTHIARVVLDNPDHRLVPGMFAELQIEGSGDRLHPLVPDDALVAAGAEARVIVVEAEGRFRPVRVDTGRSAGGMTEILRGLQGGERVVVSGQFLIDSEASLSGALERLSGPGQASGDPLQGRGGMADMDMPAPQSSGSSPAGVTKPAAGRDDDGKAGHAMPGMQHESSDKPHPPEHHR